MQLEGFKMDIKLNIHNVKFIKDYTMMFSLSKGLYAITGENASGKSTIISAAASLFYEIPMYDYFGKPFEDSTISFDIENERFRWESKGGKWRKKFPTQTPVGGFFEGSIIYGNRFRNTYFSVIRKLDEMKIDAMNSADDYVRKNLGMILHNNPNHYSNLFRLRPDLVREHHLASAPYFYRTENGTLISQARMSTGENLLISILNSLNIIRKKRERFSDNRPSLILLDEIEIALHASALRRLLCFLQEAADELELAVYFSTHSLELIRDIKPQNIFYISKQIDGTLTTTNPCYPAFATRNLYSDDGYGNDLVILCEDDLSKRIIERILIEKRLINNIRIKILPTGGWQNTITMAYDLIVSRLLLKHTKILVVLDKDIKDQVPNYINNNPQFRSIKIDYIPLNSLEKYMKKKTIESFDCKLCEMLDNYVFQNKPLNAIISQYQKELPVAYIPEEIKSEIKNGKRLFGYFMHELRDLRKDRDSLIEIIVKYLMETERESVNELEMYLKNNIEKY